MATTTRPSTEADLLRIPKDGRKYELVDGTIRMSPAGGRHGQISVRILVAMANFARLHALGEVLDSSTGFRLPNRNVRVPDVSFVAAGRFPSERAPDGFPDLAPDLAVEVVSPDDSARDVLDKIGDYLGAGVRLVCVVDPRARRAVVHRSLSKARELGAADALDGEDVLPGFQLRLSDVFQ